MKKRAATDVLDTIHASDDNSAIDAEMERILAMTPEEREAELRTAGYDVEAEKAKARAWHEMAKRGDMTELRRLAIARLRERTEKGTAQRVLDAIDAWKDEDAIDVEMERILAMTPEEIDRDLEAAGVDLKAERANAAAALEAAKRGDVAELRRLAKARLREGKRG
ncbi:MAG TPA: hypothetical protein VGY54_21170 [Polyangiaceae bacterium]|nr:hypothetical protein [Polyangiaceae bacterium]